VNDVIVGTLLKYSAPISVGNVQTPITVAYAENSWGRASFVTIVWHHKWTLGRPF